MSEKPLWFVVRWVEYAFEPEYVAGPFWHQDKAQWRAHREIELKKPGTVALVSSVPIVRPADGWEP
jgi:hypothetical protein